MTGRTHHGRAGRPGSEARLTPGDLRRLVRRVLAEEAGGVPPPDEPGVRPDRALGQYLLPGDRLDPAYNRVAERDTKLEAEFERALQDHYRGDNYSGRLVKVWPRIWELAQSGLYSRWLQPPAGSIAYRAIGGLTPAVAARVTGLKVKDILEEPGVAHRVIDSPATLSPRSVISSWTLEPSVHRTVFFATHRSRPSCSVLFAARCEPGGGGGGEFLMNPHSFAADFHLGKEFEGETEVIAHGPIEVEELSYIYLDDEDDAPDAPDAVVAARELLAALGL